MIVSLSLGRLRSGARVVLQRQVDPLAQMLMLEISPDGRDQGLSIRELSSLQRPFHLAPDGIGDLSKELGQRDRVAILANPCLRVGKEGQRARVEEPEERPELELEDAVMNGVLNVLHFICRAPMVPAPSGQVGEELG